MKDEDTTDTDGIIERGMAYMAPCKRAHDTGLSATGKERPGVTVRTARTLLSAQLRLPTIKTPLGLWRCYMTLKGHYEDIGQSLSLVRVQAEIAPFAVLESLPLPPRYNVRDKLNQLIDYKYIVNKIKLDNDSTLIEQLNNHVDFINNKLSFMRLRNVPEYSNQYTLSNINNNNLISNTSNNLSINVLQNTLDRLGADNIKSLLQNDLAEITVDSDVDDSDEER